MPLWILLNTIFRMFHADFWVFHLFQSIVINYAVCFIFHKYSNCSFVALLLYYIVIFPYFNFEILRESFSVAIFLFLVPSLLAKSYFKYYIGILFALGFHISASVLFFVPFMEIISRQKFGFVIFVIIIVVILFCSQYFTESLLLLLNIDLYADKALGYFTNTKYSLSKLNVSFVVNILFFIVLPYVLYAFSYKKREYKNLSLFPLVGMYTLIYAATLIVPIFYRLNNYFIIFFIICISGMWKGWHFERISISVVKFIGRFLLLCFLLFKLSLYWLPLYPTIYPSYSRYYPYESVIYKHTDPIRERIFFNLDK